MALDTDREWLNFAITARVFAFHTIEAYCNLILEILDHKTFLEEKTYFTKRDGVMGKIAHVMNLMDIVPEKGKRPFTTIRELKTYRDLIAHGKSESQSEKVIHPLGTDAPYPRPKWLKLLMPKEKRLAALSDVEELLIAMQTNYVEIVKERILMGTLPLNTWIDPHPLSGVHSRSIGVTTIAPPDAVKSERRQ